MIINATSSLEQRPYHYTRGHCFVISAIIWCRLMWILLTTRRSHPNQILELINSWIIKWSELSEISPLLVRMLYCWYSADNQEMYWLLEDSSTHCCGFGQECLNWIFCNCIYLDLEAFFFSPLKWLSWWYLLKRLSSHWNFI